MESKTSKPFGMVAILTDSNTIADNFNYITFSILSISMALGFLLAGFYGVVLVALGLVISPILLIAITATAAMLTAGSNFCF